ncbi:uncharacterized protein METZ01_LOCUS409390, partial [marine metagenome]
ASHDIFSDDEVAGLFGHGSLRVGLENFVSRRALLGNVPARVSGDFLAQPGRGSTECMAAVHANYERISETYGADFGGLRAVCRSVCLEQIAQHVTKVSRGLDCAVGTGDVLAALSEVVELHSIVGNALSASMLAQASELGIAGFEPLCGSALELDAKLEPASRDYIACHLLYDYCGVEPMVKMASGLLEPGGIFSSMTSTKAQYDDVFWEQAERHPLLTRLFDVRGGIRAGVTPESHAHHTDLMVAAGLEVLEERELTHALEAHDSGDAWNALYESGW